MAEFTPGKPVIATSGRMLETTDEFSLAGTYDAGSELIENGDFDGNANGWTLNDASSYSAGKVIVLYESSDDPLISVPVTLESGKIYLVQFTVSNSNDGVLVYLTTNSASSSSMFGNGIKTFLFTANVSTVDALVFDTANYVNGKGWTIDDVSVKEITEIRHALIVTDALGRTIIELGGEYSGNTALGENALANATGSGNTAAGKDAGYNITSGNNNVAIGAGAAVTDPAAGQQIAIGSALRYSGGAWNFQGGTPTKPLLSRPTSVQEIADALVELGLVQQAP